MMTEMFFGDDCNYAKMAFMAMAQIAGINKVMSTYGWLWIQNLTFNWTIVFMQNYCYYFNLCAQNPSFFRPAVCRFHDRAFLVLLVFLVNLEN